MRRINGLVKTAIIGFLVLIIVDGFVLYGINENYETQITIVSKMLKGQENKNPVESAAQLLKGNEKTTGEQGRGELRDLGYLSGRGNIYANEARHKMIGAIGLSVFVYIVFLLLLYYLYCDHRKQRKQELASVEAILSNFQSQIYEFHIDEDARAEDSTDILNRIYEKLEILSDTLKSSSKRLMKEKEETTTLVTDISHQLKTPVAGIQACFDILINEQLSEEEKTEFVGRCHDQIKGLEGLLSALLNISRMEHGMIQIKKEKLCLFDTLVEAVGRVYMKADEKNITLELDGEEHLKKLIVPHDRKWLAEAFINILENGIKYSPIGSTIRIRMLARNMFLRIEIEDEGMGIPKVEYHKIFQRFYRGQSDQVRKISGSGVGLYLTREILNRQGGSVSVHSNQGEGKTGSIFVIQLPYQ